MVTSNCAACLINKFPSLSSCRYTTIQLQYVSAFCNCVDIFFPGFISLPSFSANSTFNSTFASIVNQNTRTDVVCVIVLNLEIIDLDRVLQQLMLNLLRNDVLAVDQNENIPRTEFTGLCSALDRRIERMSRRCNDFFAVCPDMNQLVRLVDVGFDNLSFCLRRGKSPAETRALIILLHGTFFTGVYIPEAQLYQFSVPALTKILHGRVLAHRPVSTLCPARKFPILDVKSFP